MRFPLSIREVLPEDMMLFNGTTLAATKNATLNSLLDQIGIQSARDQGLRRPVTTSNITSTEDPTQICIIKSYIDDTGRTIRIVGMLRAAKRTLYLNFNNHQYIEETYVVLDFWVDQLHRSKGNGRMIFDKLLMELNIKPHELGYDRPSIAFKQFLSKHFNLTNGINQPTAITVYPTFFDGKMPYTSSQNKDFAYARDRQEDHQRIMNDSKLTLSQSVKQAEMRHTPLV